MFSELTDEELLDQYHQLDKKIKLKAFSRFTQYNAKDTDLVLQLDAKLKFIEVACTVAYLAKCNIMDTYGPVKTWDIFIYNYLKSTNIVIPPASHKKGDSFEGAWVKEPVPGMYGWTMSFDFASLYPSIIRQWNMSPETIVGMMPLVTVNKFLQEDLDKVPENCSLAANGAMFSKGFTGVIPSVVKFVLDGRKIAKKAMLKLEQEYNNTKDPSLPAKIAALNGRQMAMKILANALYGAISNAGFRYFDLRIAEAITLTGQASDRDIESSFNVYMNRVLKTIKVDYVIGGDTDSIYLNVQPLVDSFFKDQTDKEAIVKFLDQVGEAKLSAVVKRSVERIYNIGHCYTPVMDMKREAIASKAIWTAKKRYAMMVHNSEGVSYSPYKMKIMGMDLIKSSTPAAVRKMLKDSLTEIFLKDQEYLYNFVGQCKSHFLTLPAEDIAFPRGANDIDKWVDRESIYLSRTPIHVRAALMYNTMTKGSKDIVPIKNGDKVKFVYLKVPNPTHEDVIAFPAYGSLPKELGLHKYIDYEKQWEKTFISPLKGITDAIKWEVEKKANLDRFFM